MASIKYVCISLNVFLLFIYVNSNVLRPNKEINGIITSPDADVKDNRWYDDDTVSEINSYLKFDDSGMLRLKDTNTHSMGNMHQHNQIRSIHHFARHNLCRNNKGKVRFYRALKNKLCNDPKNKTNILLEDGYIDHHERNYYDD
ncbi:uncharacterized protein LOC123538649 [Mercenaria mercenaria]|uniref:uncharacterized protein LOC123538649 n=1 Tax=Mercenaria mercenaria TaxID=6596 RepID=UPI00234E37BE|nr:uncharacterized protein LOC123538649 [Mercenaria mercenaria]